MPKFRPQFRGRPGDVIEPGHKWVVKAMMPPPVPDPYAPPVHPRMAVKEPVMTIVLVRCEGGDNCGWLATIALEGDWTIEQIREGEITENVERRD